jgi:cysteinyl-tRNA synthetase
VADTGKKNPTDFAVWKFSDPTEKRDMEWDSPWGKGFPGWHLECSVMARELLDDQIDIHTGGIDHIPVHHTNEIAQTEAVTGKQFSNYWLHNNHLKVDGEKMSKSLGNIYTLQDIEDKGFDIEAFKLTILSKHYRTEGNFTWEILEASQNRLNSYRAMADQLWQPSEQGTVDDAQINQAQEAVRAALQDDLNTPGALAALSQLESAIDTGGISKSSQTVFSAFLQWIDSVLGLVLSQRPTISEEQQILIKERQEARDDQNWEISDRLRNKLAGQGIEIKDTPRGQIWNRL